jgi:hypothetical protein
MIEKDLSFRPEGLIARRSAAPMLEEDLIVRHEGLIVRPSSAERAH